VTVNNGGKVSGATSSASAAISFPPVDATFREPNANGSGISGSGYDSSTHDLTVSNGRSVTLSGGTYYFNNLTVSGGGSLNVSAATVIYLSGKLVVDNGARLNNQTAVPGNLQIYSSYSSGTGVSLQGGSDVYAAIYAPQAGFNLANGGKLSGSVVASSLDIAGGARIHYDSALQKVSTAYHASGSGGSGSSNAGWDRH
jgi:hypothetical protein